MTQRIYNLRGDANHNIEYGLENTIKHSAAYLRNSFLWQCAKYIGRYFPDINITEVLKFYELLNVSQELHFFH
jgi:hypothetical protein